MNVQDLTGEEPAAVNVTRQHVFDRPDGYGINTGECGDTVEIFLATQGSLIDSAHYQSDGCMATHLCALLAVELTTGRGIEHAWTITPELIIASLPDLPADHHHCAELAAGALYRALVDLKENVNRPWAKLYRPHRRP
jgi:nitrogen fixation NifU-like protein